jgi:hypothetical protein
MLWHWNEIPGQSTKHQIEITGFNFLMQNHKTPAKRVREPKRDVQDWP